jgi:DNA-binding GntR family transcriptional regulator
MSAVLESRPADASAEPRLLHATVAGRLRDMIVEGELAPGIKLNERVLAEQLGTSRTPLREALKSLASEGLVELLPNRGAVVAPLDAQRIRDVFAVMGGLEALAGELVCRHASEADLAEIRALHYQMVAHYQRRELAPYFRTNQQIHLRLLEASGNAVLAQTYRQLNDQVRRARYMANTSPERWDQAVAEHAAILDALVARDAPRLQRLLQDHLGHKMVVVMEALARSAGATDPE